MMTAKMIEEKAAKEVTKLLEELKLSPSDEGCTPMLMRLAWVQGFGAACGEFKV